MEHGRQWRGASTLWRTRPFYPSWFSATGRFYCRTVNKDRVRTWLEKTRQTWELPFLQARRSRMQRQVKSWWTWFTPGQRKLFLPGVDGAAAGTPALRYRRGRGTGFRRASGEPGRGTWVDSELKLIADAVWWAAPMLGKSTLLSVVSAAKPKVANYPFTTLTPMLGVVSLGEGSTFVLADIPGLIEGPM